MIEKRSARDHRRCFFDISIDGELAGRIVMEVFDELAPRTCENFVMLCTGQAGTGKLTGKPLHYKGSLFHRVVKGFMIQGGDFSAANGTGGESIYGGVFEDEDFAMKHDEPFMLSMANRGKDSNGSQFFITTAPASHLDGVHVVFGKVISGKELVTRIENLKVNAKNRPVSDVLISGCGQLVKKKRDVSSGSNEQSEEDERHRKKKHKKEKKRDRSSEEKRRREEPNKPTLPDNISSIKVEDLPEEPGGQNKFLHRRSPTPERHRDRREQQTTIRTTRTGHKVKGRGAIRFRADEYDRSRSVTPPHWKREEQRLITLSELEKIKKQKKEREEQEAKRRDETTEIDTFGYRRRPGFELPPVQDHHRGHRLVMGDTRDHREHRSRSRERSREFHRSSRKSDENGKSGHHSHSKKQQQQSQDEEEEEEELEDVGPIIDMDYLLAKVSEKEQPKPVPVPEPIPVDPMPPVKEPREEPKQNLLKRKDSPKEAPSNRSDRDSYQHRRREEDTFSHARISSRERNERTKEAEPSRRRRDRSRSRSPFVSRTYQQRFNEHDRDRTREERGARDRDRRPEGSGISRHQERNPSPPPPSAKKPVENAPPPGQAFKSTKINLDEVLEKANAHAEAQSLAALNKQRETNQRKLMEESRSIMSKPGKEGEEDRSSKRKRQSPPPVDRNEPKRHRSPSKSPRRDVPMRERSKSPVRDRRVRRSPSPRSKINQSEITAARGQPPNLPAIGGVSSLLLKSNSPPKVTRSNEKILSSSAKKERSMTPEKSKEKVALTTETRGRRRSRSAEKKTITKSEVRRDTKKERSKSLASKSPVKKSSPVKRGRKSRSASSASSKTSKKSMSPPAHFRDGSSSSSASSRSRSDSSDNSARRRSKSRSTSRDRRRDSSLSESTSSSSTASSSSSSTSSHSSSDHSRRGRRSGSRSRSNRRYTRRSRTRSRSRSYRRRRRSSSGSSRRGRRSRSRSYRRGRYSRSRSRRR